MFHLINEISLIKKKYKIFYNKNCSRIFRELKIRTNFDEDIFFFYGNFVSKYVIF